MAAPERVTSKQLEKVFTDYIVKQKILIVDKTSNSRTGISRILTGFGVSGTQLTLASSYDEAKQIIHEKKPNIVITEYDLKPHSGLDLFQEQRSNNTDANSSLFILVTGNTSQAAVSEAAEEDIDAYILKPYTAEVLRNTILKVALAKLRPAPYAVAIGVGKKLMSEGKVDEALTEFEKAKVLIDKPALAYFYSGQIQVLKSVFDEAEGKYAKGLDFNRIHYKCLTGLFDLYMGKKEEAKAYEIVKKVATYFPANPKRLLSVLKLAVATRNWDDIEKYYQNFIEIETRDPALVRYICVALIACGKIYIRKKLKSRAIPILQKAAISSVGDPSILRQVTLAYLEGDLLEEAKQTLKRFQDAGKVGTDYYACSTLIIEKTQNVDMAIQVSHSHLQNGIKDPDIYAVLIRSFLKRGFRDRAETAITNACETYPEKAAFFKGLLGNQPIAA